jgi:tetraacyldisaccharide 4'-kinase
MSGPRKALLAPLAYPLSRVYAAGIKVWRRRRASALDIGVPVLSVGSISVGGTGKTPLSMLIAEHFRDLARSVAIVSRGYKRKRGPSPLVVSDGRDIRAGVEEAGDEPYLMARRLAGVPVVIDSDRVRGALEARDVFGPDIILLDDGFQCRGISKRLDIVTLGPDALAPGAGYLPWGPLREGLDAVGEEDFMVYVARSQGERDYIWGEEGRGAAAHLRRRKHFYLASYTSPVIVDGGGSPGEAPVGPAVVVSGIARPEGFEATCGGLGIEVALRMRFDDHHWYGPADVELIEGAMRERGCQWLLTTEKDFWRLPAGLRERARAVRVSLEVDDTEFLMDVTRRMDGHD